jgi:translocation and assembly module TamB
LLIDGLDARVSGRFRLDGELSPQPHGRVEFELVDSRLLGRPLAGSGRASLQQDQSLQVDATLAVRSARIIARGSLGQPGSVLTVSADVPSLLELALPVDGALALEATLRGTLPRPAVDAHIDLRRLRYETHRVEQAQAVLNYGGGDDGTLAVRATATDHRFGANRPLSLQSATVSIDGRLGEHTVRVDAVNLDTEPLALAARGGWRDARWIGAITSAAVGRPLNLRLLEELALSTNFSDLRVGPGRFELVGAIVEQFRIDADGQSLSTSGRFGNLRPTELVMSSTPTILPATPRSPLTLRGEWDLRFGVQADGHLRIERAEGDLYTGATGGPIGVRELRLEAALRANRLTATAILRGDAGGRLDASLQADTERAPGVGWRLAQQRPLSFRTQAILPSVDWINALLSERIRANVRLAGSLAANVTIEGTPAQPRATGGITGAALRVAWIEQGVRLENGVLIARVEDDAIILDELRFSGPPRVQPADRRAARAAGGEPGFVTLNGRLSLRDLKGVLQVAAERLPLLQRTDRWVMATGGANIILSERRVEVNGAAVAVAGFIDFSRPDLPSLPDDVSVVRPGDAPSGRIAEPQVQFDFDLGIGLGDAFYLRGLGLDTRADGALRVRSEGRGVIRATGSVEARDGTYEGFGQKLAIQRGRVNFVGSLENPGLDVLALRTGLPVEVGVSITRTAADPLIRLHSDPAMADVEVLSWLVLGRPAELGAADNVALARAAAGLLSGTGEGIPAQLARTLGIDEISLRAGDLGAPGSILPRQTVAGATRGDARLPTTVGTEIIVVGKRLSDAVTISYEQALSGAANSVLISYRLTERLSLVARSGTDTALELVYSFAFD